MRTLERTRQDLAAFLRTCRERTQPEQVGLPGGARRRTPGLRREELAALAGVGVTWYTWLEQGRDIGVSADFLDRLARVLSLSAAERHHLFLLAHNRPPVEQGKTWCTVPPLVLRLMHDLPHAAYILNLRWDILAFNSAADALFGFARHEPIQRNLLWLMFMDPDLRAAFADPQAQTAQVISRFRQDYARAAKATDIDALVDELGTLSPEFREMWRGQSVPAPSPGVSTLNLNGERVNIEHTSFITDADRHLRMVVYARQQAG